MPCGEKAGPDRDHGLIAIQGPIAITPDVLSDRLAGRLPKPGPPGRTGPFRTPR